MLTFSLYTFLVNDVQRRIVSLLQLKVILNIDFESLYGSDSNHPFLLLLLIRGYEA